jgi:glycosyltransferase involved in cell wall biosynthesis
MKRIAFIYDQVLDFGGVETHLLSIFRQLDRSRYTPILMAPTSPRFQGKVQACGVKIVPVSPFKPFSLRAVRELIEHFRQEKIDLVNLHSPIAAISGRAAAKIAGLPAVVTVHAPSTKFYGSRRTLRAWAGRVLYVTTDRILNYLLTDRLIYVSRTVYQQAIRIRLSPRRKSTFILNGIDLSQYGDQGNRLELREKWETGAGAAVICFAGRLSEEKGIDLLLEAAASLRKDHPAKDFTIWIIGEGAEKDRLKKLANILGIEKIVRFMGFQEQVAEYLSASDIFVLPSRHEAMSMVLLEALASGLPCIVTEVGESARVVQDGEQGLVIAPNSVEPLREALEKLLSDAHLLQEMSQKACLRAVDFSVGKMVQALQELYEEILSH